MSWCRSAAASASPKSSKPAVRRTFVKGRHNQQNDAVDLAPVAWPWRLADGVVGVLPRSDLPTVDEFIAGLTCAQAVA